MMILIVGPYRSGTGNHPGKMAANLERLETTDSKSIASVIYR